MLYILTGSIQIGKTRWLKALVDEMEAMGRPVYGVVAPGDWRPCEEGGFEKYGIFNELLPGHRRLLFAMRADLANECGELPSGIRAAYERRLESEREGKDVRGLPPEMVAIIAKKHEAGGEGKVGGQAPGSSKKLAGWLFDEDVLGEVNAHFERLAGMAAAEEAPVEPTATSEATEACNTCADGMESPRGFFVVDELGWMELLKGGGLTEAVRLLDQGPNTLWPDALVVVREDLLPYARDRFAAAWGEPCVISPNDEAKAELLA